jgi:glycerol-3-phosphate acyltransferase PlsY
VPLLLVLASYLLGSIPFGLLLARTAGIDVRRTGSGNIGATNVARAAGARLGLATLVADVAKGALPVVAARALGDGGGTDAAAGLAAFAGHLFPITLRFAGGKGVATALGAILVLSPPAAAVAIGVFVVVLGGAGYVSAASVSAALVVPPILALLGAPAAVIATGATMAAGIVLRHRDNLRRLQAGVEPRVALRKRQAPPIK